MIKIFAPSADCISKITNTQIDNVKDNDIIMPRHNLRECSDSSDS